MLAISNENLYDFVCRYDEKYIEVIKKDNEINVELIPEIDIILNMLLKEEVINLSSSGKINNLLVEEIIKKAHSVNTNLRHLIHKRTNVEDQYYLITNVVNSLIKHNYIVKTKTKIEFINKEIDQEVIYREVSFLEAMSIFHTNSELVLLTLYVYLASCENINEIKISSVIELANEKMDILLGEKPNVKKYIQAFKKLEDIINLLGGEININSKVITIKKHFSDNVVMTLLEEDSEELIPLKYHDIENDETNKVYKKVINSIFDI